MNNKFDYDKDNMPAPQVQSARQLSNGQWYVNGKILNPDEMTPEQKAGAKDLQRIHNARLSSASAEKKRQCLKKFQNYKNSLSPDK